MIISDKAYKELTDTLAFYNDAVKQFEQEMARIKLPDLPPEDIKKLIMNIWYICLGDSVVK